MVNSLLILCSRISLDKNARLKVKSMIESHPDWEQTILNARQEGVGPLLFYHLKPFKSQIPAKYFEQMRSLYVKNAAHSFSLLKIIEPFFHRIKELDTHLALIKGARLALTLYPDPALRPYVDIDIVISTQHKEKVDHILESLGFLSPGRKNQKSYSDKDETFWMYRPYFSKGRCPVEIHMNFPGLPELLDSSDALWENRGSARIGKTDAPVLSQEEELCLLCLHAQQHSYSRLIWLTDIVEAATRWKLDWDQVFEICDKKQIHASVYYALLTINTLWPHSVSPQILARFQVSWLEKKLLNFFWPQKGLRSRSLSLDFPMHIPTLFTMLARKKLVTALKTLLRIYFPPRHWVKHYYGISNNTVGLIRHYIWRLYRPIDILSRRILRLY